MTNTDAPARPTSYNVLVRGLRGRKWFTADSASCGDRDFVQRLVDDCAATYPGLLFRLGENETHLPSAPKEYTPWATADDDEDDADANLDELADADL